MDRHRVLEVRDHPSIDSLPGQTRTRVGFPAPVSLRPPSFRYHTKPTIVNVVANSQTIVPKIN